MPSIADVTDDHATALVSAISLTRIDTVIVDDFGDISAGRRSAGFDRRGSDCRRLQQRRPNPPAGRRPIDHGDGVVSLPRRML
jgi:hypothetical protein